MKKVLFKIQAKHSWLLVILIAFIVLSPNLNNDWVNWDDQAYVHQNNLIKSIGFQETKAIFSEPNVVGNYHPITVLSLANDYSIGELKPFVYHLHSLILHLFNCVLVFFLISVIFKNYTMSFLVAMLFSIHPLHLESVAWISARKDLLYAFYLLLGLHAHLKYIQIKKPQFKGVYYTISLIAFCFSLLSKSMAIVFPIYLLLIDFLTKRTSKISNWVEKFPFILISLFFVFLTLYSQSIEGAIINDIDISLLDRMAISCTSIWIYIIKSILPYNLSGFYPYPFQILSEIPLYFYCSFIIIPCFGALFWYAWKKEKRILFFSFAFFLISLAPVLQIIPHGRAMLAERYTYIAYLGLFILIAHLLRKYYSHMLFKIITLTVIITFSSITYVRSSVWKNGETLWTDVIESFPHDYFAYTNRGDYYFNENKLELALEDVNKSIALYPILLRHLI